MNGLFENKLELEGILWFTGFAFVSSTIVIYLFEFVWISTKWMETKLVQFFYSSGGCRYRNRSKYQSRILWKCNYRIHATESFVINFLPKKKKNVSRRVKQVLLYRYENCIKLYNDFYFGRIVSIYLKLTIKISNNRKLQLISRPPNKNHKNNLNRNEIK